PAVYTPSLHDALPIYCSISTSELAERVGLSQSPCWRRIQRLKDEGYIKAQVAILDAEKAGFHLHVFAQLKIKHLSEDERERFLRSEEHTSNSSHVKIS